MTILRFLHRIVQRIDARRRAKETRKRIARLVDEHDPYAAPPIVGGPRPMGKGSSR